MNVIKKQLKDIKAPIYKSVDYRLLKMKPDSRLNVTFYDSIIQAIYSTYKDFWDRLSVERTGKLNCDVNIHMNNPITYEIMFDGDDKKTTPIICFGIPENHANYMKQRIQGILPQSTLTFEDDYSDKFQDCYMCEYNYEKDSMLSLKIKDNNFLQAILNLKNDIQKGERILFQVEMTPISDMWKSFQDDKWEKARKGKDVATKRGIVTKCFDIANDTLNEVLSVTDDIMGISNISSKKESIDKKEKAVNMSAYTGASKTKKASDGFSVRIKAYIVCKSKLVAKSYATTIETAMRELEEDNRLVMGNMKTKSVSRGVSAKTFIPLNRNIMGAKELASIVNIPNQKLQREFKIDSINVKQVSPPQECMDDKSWIRIGTLELYGEKKNTYFPSNRDYLAMPKFYICPMGGGKTTVLLNYSNDVLASKQSLIDINFVNECEIAHALKEMHPNHIVIDLSDENNIPALMFPEIRINENDTPSKRRKDAGNFATEVEYFINSITSNGTEDISSRMSQYLICSAKLIAIYKNMNIRTAFDILEDKNVRDKWINKAIESGVYTEESYEIRKLQSLDEDKSGKLTAGIIDRYSELMKHEVFQQMLESENPQFDFIDIMDNNKSISICMPEKEFTNKAIKDVIITYLMCRIRLAMLGRKDKDKVVHVLIDEAHHLKKSLKVISNSIAEPRKYGVAFCFCSHYFNQLGEELKEAVLNVGGHFILIKGVGKSVFDALESKIGEDWTYDDLKEMEDYNSFNMIWIRGKHYVFVSKMLEPLRNNKGVKYIK